MNFPKSTIQLLLASTVLILSNSLIAQEFNKKNLTIMDIKAKDLADAPKKVYIKTFKIYYQMIAEAETTVQGGRQLGGGSYTGDATARLAVGVEGINPEDLQKLTNEVYNRYVANLKAMGMEVYTSNDIPDIEYFEEWQKIDGPTINEEQVKGSLMVIPEGFSYYVKRVTKKGKEKTGAFMSGVTGNDGSFTSSMYGPIPNISKELDDMFVVEVALNVPSIYLDPSSRLGTAKVKGGPYLRLSQAKASYISGKLGKPGVASPQTSVEVLLKDAVPIGGVFKDEKFKSVATRSVTSVPSYAAFFSIDNKTMELSNTIECDAAVYSEEVKKRLTGFLDVSLDKLKTGIEEGKIK